MKRRDRDPALPIESVEREFYRNERPQLFLRNWPVCEQEIIPGLLHDPGSQRQRPWTVRYVLECGMQVSG